MKMNGWFCVGFLLLILLQVAVCGTMSNKSPKMSMLPHLTPHSDPCYLIEFVGDDDISSQMEPLVKRLEDDLCTSIRRLNIMHSSEYQQMFEYLNGSELPFFYNRRTAQTISGPTMYDNLKNWGMGRTHKSKLTPEAVAIEKANKKMRFSMAAIGWNKFLDRIKKKRNRVIE